MSRDTLSAVLERQIHRLCLKDFPCGYGSWRTSRDGAEGAGAEETGALLDLLSCPRSPWRRDDSWSPQAAALRRLAVLAPERLHAGFIYSYFTTLRIVDKGVSVVDDGLLKFSRLEELVLSANKISEISTRNLPSTLKILELRANRLSALNSLISCPLPGLQYLGLGGNFLGSHADVAHLTGRHWPQLVCLDLSDCEFQDQRALLSALISLPCLRTLVLEGNPFTLASSYPGFTVDGLPQLGCLDASWITPEERRRFKGLTEMHDLIVDQATVTVCVGRMRGIPSMSADEDAPDFPVITYSYFITYQFLSHQTPVNLTAEDGCSSDADLQSNKNTGKEDLTVSAGETCHDVGHGSRHSTSKLTWSECMDFSDAQTHAVSDLERLKRLLNRGLHLRLEEEKVLSWPAVSEDAPVAKPSRPVKEKKGGKGKESPVKSGSTKDKSKDKKKKSLPEMVQDAPIRRTLGSAHVPLQSLIKRSRKVDVLCDFGALHTESEEEATQDLGKKIKEDKKKEDKDAKRRGGSGTRQKSTASSKGKGKGRREGEMEANSESARLEPVTVELRVELEKWESASEAHKLQHPQQNSSNKQPDSY